MNRTIQRLLCWICLVSLVPSKEVCQKPCYCTLRTESAVCNSRHLTYIPKLPSFVKHVKFIQNNFSVLDRNFFRNLTEYNTIKDLNMTDNFVKTISSDAFMDFGDLISLEISAEPNLNITALKQSFRSLSNSQIQWLFFPKNEWKNLPVDFFAELKNVRNLSLYLNENQLRDLHGEIFSRINITLLNASNNVIKNVHMEELHTLKILNLVGNYISDVPKWNKGNVCLVPNLKTLCLDGNAITEISYESFRCLPKLEYLRLDYNNIRILKNNTFSALERLRTLHISHNTRLKMIEDVAFNASSLKSLYFQNNVFHFDKSRNWNAKSLFRYCPNVKMLDMTNNFLPPISNMRPSIARMLKPLAKLEKLVLANTRIRYLPLKLLPNLRYLKTLNLQGNYLRYWNDSVKIFGYNSSLKVLNLAGNNIRLINKTTFPDTLLDSLQRLDLSDNYFSCTCDQMWFRDWIRKTVESNDTTHTFSLNGYPKRYVCMFPNELKGVLLKEYNPTTDSCREKNPYVIVVVVVTSFVLTSIIIVIVLHRCQTNIRNYIYLCRLYRYKKSGYIRIVNGNDYEYDAFIIYCDADREWVHNICLKRLEEEEGMKVCIHHRDFDIGQPVTGNIEKYMNKCHKVVVVMSNNFAESEWCQWEVDLVLDRRRKQGKDVLILVMLKSIDSKHMTNSLKALLQSTSHLKYCSGIGSTTFWRALIKGLRKPFSQPPVAVLN